MDPASIVGRARQLTRERFLFFLSMTTRTTRGLALISGQRIPVWHYLCLLTSRAARLQTEDSFKFSSSRGLFIKFCWSGSKPGFRAWCLGVLALYRLYGRGSMVADSNTTHLRTSAGGLTGLEPRAHSLESGSMATERR